MIIKNNKYHDRQTVDKNNYCRIVNDNRKSIMLIIKICQIIKLSLTFCTNHKTSLEIAPALLCVNTATRKTTSLLSALKRIIIINKKSYYLI